MTGSGARPAPAPDGIEPIVGYRLWRVEIGTSVLLAFGGEPWSTDGWTRAACRPRMPRSGGLPAPHEAPDEACTCGLHAMKSAADLVRVVLDGGRATILDSVVLIGKVLLGGKVIEHDLGYRAGQARLVELLPLRHQTELAAEVAAAYGARVDERFVRLPRREAIALARSS